jgi:hypothetical protein
MVLKTKFSYRIDLKFQNIIIVKNSANFVIQNTDLSLLALTLMTFHKRSNNALNVHSNYNKRLGLVLIR